jgi:hypothetical protein
MNAVTFGGARTPATALAKSARVSTRWSFFARFVDALKETRRQEARRVVERYAHLLPPDGS